MGNTNKRWIKVVLAVLPAAGLVFGIVGCQQGRQVTVRQAEAARSRQFDYERVELDNGLNVITLEDFSCPIVAVQIWYHVGSKDEDPQRQGFAHMFEHMMFRGTDRLGPTDHFGFIRRIGGTSNGYTGFDRTVYLETVPADQVELALWLEAERMAFLKIDQEAFDVERKVVEEERRMGLNEPYGGIVEKLLEEIYEVHPYRWPPIGKIPHLRAAGVAELRDFWKRYYVPSNATLIIVGAIEHSKAQELAKEYFGWMPRYEEPERVTVVEPQPAQGKTVTFKEDNAPTPAVGVVYRTVSARHEDSVVLDIMANILGGGNSSRLYRDLVAERQIAVAVESFMWSLQQDGIFAAGAVLPPFGADLNKVLESVEEHVSKFRNEDVSAAELAKAKNQMLRQLVVKNLTIESKAKALGSAEVIVGDVSRINTELEDIRKVTAGDIRRAANKYLRSDRVLRGKIERNLLGMVTGKTKQEEAPITAEPEKQAPKPGRDGVVRPESYPQHAPFAKAKPKKLTPKYTSRRLDNGLKVMVVPNKEVPFVTARLGLLTGAWAEDKPGTAAMAMKMLVKGTENYTEAQLSDELGMYAIGLGGSGQMDTSTVNMNCLTEHTDRAMKLLGEVVLKPTFPEAEFEKLRNQVKTSLAISSAEPKYVVEKEFRHRLYAGHPYSRTAVGEVEDVNALAVEDLKRWWEKFVRPDKAVLIFAGDIEEDKAYALAETTFGNWKSLPSLKVKKLPKLAELGQTHIYLVDRPGSVQSRILVGHRGIVRKDDGYFVSRLVSSYFGWGFDSRLNETVRVEKGLTYSIWGSYIANRFAGEFKIGTFSKPDSTADAVRAVLEEVERLKSEQASEDELEHSRSYILGSFVRNRETPQQVADDLWLIESQHLDSDYLERLLDGIGKARIEDCKQLVNRTIQPGNLVVVVVGEAAELKEQLEKIAPVTVVSNNK